MNGYTRGGLTVHTDPAQVTKVTSALRHVGRQVVFVPTMGALHEGHLQLVEQARMIPNSVVVVSIFVNPLQFDDAADLDAYPRTLDADVEKLRGTGVELVFAPNARDMYPDGPRTTIHPGPVGEILEGAHRPGHFAGMLTVVNKLFAIVRPHRALFGEKDYQQLVLVNQMVRDLNMDVRVTGVPTVREADGLAMSSRNARLSPEERDAAATLCAALVAGAHAAQGGVDAILTTAREVLATRPEIDVEYLEVRARDLGDPPGSGDARLLVAARVGGVRLIDNVGVAVGTGFLARAEADVAANADAFAEAIETDAAALAAKNPEGENR